MTTAATTLTAAEAKQIAETILAQFGGRRFIVMTGAKNFTHDNEGTLRFQYPARKGFKVSAVKVVLTPADVYEIEFIDVKRNGDMTRKTLDGVYCDQLQEIFTRETGLYTHF